MKYIYSFLILFLIYLTISTCNLYALTHKQSNTISDTLPLLKIGLIADIQYCDCDARGTRFYRNSLPKIEEAVKQLNENEVDLTVNLGDLSDKTPSDIDTITARLSKLKTPIHNIAGNHDYMGITDNQILYGKLKMPSEYYTLHLSDQNIALIFLNTNEISSYANITNTHKQKEFENIMTKIKKENRINGYEWNGGISNKQLTWLDNVLTDTDNKNIKVIIFTHHPLYPKHDHNTLNDIEVLSVLEKHESIKAVFSGHYHKGNFGKFNNIPFITLEGMIETEYDNSFGIMKIYENRLIVEGKGRMTSRSFTF
ncbi:metallophosphoesterase [Dysgonomonas sp. Marseille-P4361]|uniref:metallophosphoesterase n=1 Tax=Dysgonomonas sp. Marseille-P4361 TaxID=2161820 RepID=UPI000D55F241|nr:metallophosphoesterase [Dysgonomonas sp. Marseille-P4361]